MAVKIKSRHPKISGLINVAGIASMNLALLTPPKITQKLIQTNLIGTIYSCQIFSPLMIKNKSGSIIFISSTSAKRNDVGRFADSGSDCFFYYKLNEGSGTNGDDACDDEENDLTVSGASWVSAKMGNGLDFDGSNDEATASIGSIDLSADWSFEAWVNYDVDLPWKNGVPTSAFQTSLQDF